MRALRILVVEDDAMIGASLTEMLSGIGHFVCAIAATEAGAVAAAACHRPDLMIVDIQLREGNGVSAMQAILRDRPVAHLFISGGFVQAVRSRAVTLRKPFREPELVRAIERTLDAAPTSATVASS